MAKKPYKLKYVILCDDARREVAGKEILIGVYNDIIIVHAFPARLRQLVTRISIDALHEEEKEYKFSLRSPSGEELTKTSIIIDGVKEETGQILVMVWGSPSFPEEGVYYITLEVDGKTEKIYSFFVRAVQSEEEAARISI